jgi:hypothetical protein
MGSKATAAFDLVRDLLVVVPTISGRNPRDLLRSSGAIVFGHSLGFVSSGVQLLRKRLLYGNDEIVRRFITAVEGESDSTRWMTGRDGVATIDSLETILGDVGLEMTPA